MGLQISTNAGAVAANYYLGKNSRDLEKSMSKNLPVDYGFPDHRMMPVAWPYR